jgi:hypothetical protein
MIPPKVSFVRYSGSPMVDGKIVWNRRRGQGRSRGAGEKPQG